MADVLRTVVRRKADGHYFVRWGIPGTWEQPYAPPQWSPVIQRAMVFPVGELPDVHMFPATEVIPVRITPC